MAKRSYGSGSLGARGDESWYGIWCSGGRRVKRALGRKRSAGSRDGLTRAQAEAELRRRMQEDVVVVARAERKTLAEAGERYVKHLAQVKQRKRTTIQDYRGYLGRHLVPYFGERALVRIGPEHIEGYLHEKLATLTAKTVTNHLTFFHGLFSFAIRRRWTDAIPIYAELGAINRDGNGGSRYLHERALGGVGAFFQLRDGTGSAAARLSSLRLTAAADVEMVAKETAALLTDLHPRPAFYVRLLATDDAEFSSVERFFREVVDAVVVERGFTPQEMGRTKPEEAFMNLEIFRALHRAGIVIVDLTAVRPNCTMELGYALARRRRIVISAKKGTKLPFGPDKLAITCGKSPRRVTSGWRPIAIGSTATTSFRPW
jgi:hypothetical protein